MHPGRFFLLVPLLVCTLLTFFPGAAGAAECPPDETRLCLQEGRFQVQVSWTDHDGNSGEGQACGITGDTGAFWFFSPANLEVMIKVLDGRAVNGHFWVFYGALSDVRYTITVTDTATGAERTYANAPGQLASRADTDAFPDPAAPAGAASLASVSAAATLPGSPEFRVNVTTAGIQRSPSIAIDDAGNTMVVWGGEQDGPPGGLALYGRIYDALGNPRTGEFLVAEPTTGFLFTSKVAANRSGEFLVVWDEDGRILARRFGGNGQPVGQQVRLNPAAAAAGPPAIARRPQGGFIVVWTDVDGIRGLLLDEQGSPPGAKIEVFPSTSQLGEPHISVSSAGNFVVTWSAGSDFFFEVDIWARRFGADGHPQGDAILVNGVAPYQAGYQTGAIPVALPDGSFTVVWETGLEIRNSRLGVFSRFFAAGQPPADVVELNPPGNLPHLSTLALATDRLGRILLLWNGYAPEDEDGLFGRLLDSAGRPAGETFLANVFREQSQTEPALVATGAGDFVAVWASGTDYPAILPAGNPGLLSQDGSYFGVFGRRFSGACLDGATVCLRDRFQVRVSWTDHDGNTGVGRPVSLTSDTGAFWFFGSGNLELMIKILDGGAVNGRFWVFYGALSDVRYTLTVTDTATGATRTYTNPPGQLASRADTEAFPLE